MTSSPGADWLASYSFLVVFANDGTIDSNELRMLERIAIRDGVIDEEEKQVLRSIFDRVKPGTLKPEVAEEIVAFRAKYAV